MWARGRQMTQLVFDLSQGEAFGKPDFFVSDSNAAASGWIERWPEWPSAVLVLHGPRGAGKTHLAYMWRERAAATLVAGDSLAEGVVEEIFKGGRSKVVVDDADRSPEAALLHLFNACVEVGGSLLLTAQRAPGPWRPALADLGSRLRAAPAVGIDLPDDPLLGAVLAKHFADRQVRVASEVIAYLVRHIERSLGAAGEIAVALDQVALSRGCAITIPLANRVLAARTAQPLPPGDAGIT
jgi:chromosomal replication initiation ATPase DnaA